MGRYTGTTGCLRCRGPECTGENLVGFYVTGSLMMGSWNPVRSDIDICVVIHTALSEKERGSLQTIHARFATTLVGRKLEGEYVTLASLQAKDYSGSVGTVSGGQFSLGPNQISHDNLVCLNQYSLALMGSAFSELGVTVSPEELRAAVRGMLEEDRAEGETETDFSKKLYLLMNSLRCIYTLQTGKLPTKPIALEANRDLIDPVLHEELRAYYRGEIESFEIPNQAISRVMDFGLQLRSVSSNIPLEEPKQM